MTDEPPRSILGMVFLTVLIDMIGFSVIFPLFPQMLTYYVGLEGPHSLVGQLAHFLGQIAAEPFAVVALFGGVLGSLYSVLQFLFAPLWGGLSDRIGRRPTLLVTLAGTAFSYALWFVAGTFGVLVIARLVGGVMAGNVSTASAVVADRCEGPERAKGMGILGAAIGLGFVIGPAVGGVTALWNVLASWPAGSAYGINPFSACAGASFLLASINFLWVARRFPETRRALRVESAAVGTAPRRTINPIGALLRIDQPGVRLADLAYFLYLTAFSAMEFSLTFLAVERLAYQPLDNMWMFVFVGITIAVIQGGVVRRLVPRLGERMVTTVGIGLTIPGFVIVGAARTSAVLYVGLALLSVGSALVMPSLSALVSRYSPVDRQGLSLGIFRSLGSLARAIGPILGGVAYWRLGSWAPYYLGAGVLLAPLGLSMLLPPVADQPEVPAES